MSLFGIVRGWFCVHSPMHDTLGEPNSMNILERAFDEGRQSHITGSGSDIPEHGSHSSTTKHNSSMNYIKTMVSNQTVFINNMPPILAGDQGEWECSDDGVNTFIIGDNQYNVFIENKSACVEGHNQTDLHGGQGKIINGGSPNVFVGLNP
jgi:hypothetical protein